MRTGDGNGRAPGESFRGLGKLFQLQVGLWLAVFALSRAAAAFELTNSQNLGSQACLGGIASDGSGGEFILNTGGNGNRSDPYVFDWSNKDRRGSDASSNLVLHGWTIGDNATGNTKSFVLDLNGGSITGNTAAGAVALDTTPAGVSSYYPGHITILGADSIAMGRILTSRWASPTNPAGNTAGGNVTVGQTSRRAGNVRVGGIDAHGDSVSSGRTAGDVTIHGTGAVWIASDEGPGDVLTFNTRGVNRCGNITITHGGDLAAGALDTGSWKGATNPPGAVILNGDFASRGPAGAAGIGAIATGNPSGGPAGNVTIEGYRSLTVSGAIFAGGSVSNAGTVRITRIGAGGVWLGGVATWQSQTAADGNAGAGGVLISNVVGGVRIRGDLDAHSACEADAANAGNATIHALRDVRIDGAIDLGHGHTAKRAGTLRLVASDRIAGVWLQDLDLGKVRTATLYSGSRHTVIQGALLNFPVNAPAGGKLDAEAGQWVHYNPAVAANAYLMAGSTGVYTLPSGGILTPQPAPQRGTIVSFY